MIDPNVLRYIHVEIRRQLNTILSCYTENADNENCDIDQPFPGADKITARPVVHPFGFVSKAPNGTLALSGRVGEHPGARIVFGHRDKMRKDIPLDEGEVCLYNAQGEKIFLKKDKIQLGDISANEPAALGNVLAECLGVIFDILIQGQSVLTTAPGNPTAPNPAVAANLTAKKAQYITNILTNILSQETFVRRAKT